MSLVNKPYTFTVGAVIVASEHNSNFDTIYADYNGNITNENISGSAAISDGKLAQITTAGKVSGAAITSLSSTPSGAGKLPGANGGVPSGCVIMWSGTIATIPSGYVLCDGTNSTPDLRNLFIVGADADSGGVAKSTVTGSPLQTSATGVMPAHTHDVVAQYNPGTGAAGSGNSGGNATLTTTSAGTGTKVIAVFYALAFIMKT